MAEADNDPLMAAAFHIVAEELFNGATALYLQVAFQLFKGQLESLVAGECLLPADGWVIGDQGRSNEGD